MLSYGLLWNKPDCDLGIYLPSHKEQGETGSVYGLRRASLLTKFLYSKAFQRNPGTSSNYVFCYKIVDRLYTENMHLPEQTRLAPQEKAVNYTSEVRAAISIWVFEGRAM